MKNFDIAKALFEIADLLEMQEVPFKPQAYRKAAMGIEGLSEDIADIHRQGKLEELPGVGKSIAEKIAELLETGKLKYLEGLRKQFPVNVEELMKIPGLGPKKITLLYRKFRITNMKELKQSCRKHMLCKIQGLGETTEQNILKGIELVEKRPTERMLLGYAVPIAEQLLSRLRKVPGIKKLEIAGSYRRGKETIGDIDILAIASSPQKVMDAFVSMPEVGVIVARGSTRSAVRLQSGLAVDIRVLREEEFGSALLYFTGSKEHNVALRKIALSRGYTLSEYGLFALKGRKEGKVVAGKRAAGKTEEEVYQKLGMQWMPPEMREDSGEIAAALQKKIPQLVTWKDVKGDFQTQTNWSDGAHSIEEMARAAKEMGLQFIAITDHVGQIGITHPLDEKRLAQQAKEIAKVEKKVDIRIFTGGEIDIKKDGTLALGRQALKKLDFALVSVHSAWKMPEKEMTRRICSAFEKYPCASFAHPTGRLIYEREPYNIDLEAMFDAAKRTNTCLEINGSPERMDLKDTHARMAKQRGCMFTFGSDAHNVGQLSNLNFSSITARRGWIEAKDVLNCWPLQKIEKFLEGKR